MAELAEWMAKLSPAQRKLFLLKLDKETRKKGSAGTERIVARSRDSNSFPLSFAQQRLWVLDQLEPGTPLYNLPNAFRLSGPLSAAVLERTFREIVHRHEVLRTHFRSEQGKGVQLISPAIDLDLPMIDLSALAKGRREAELRSLALQEARRPFDLSRGPLLLVRVVRLEDGEHAVLMTMHHIVSDGWSFGVLLREVAALYEAYSRGAPSPLPELEIQYADFASWQRQWLSGEVLESELSYWEQKLSDAPPVLNLPTDRPRPPVRGARGAEQRLRWSQDLSASVGELSQREDATLFMTLLTGLVILLSRYTGRQDLVVGTPIANRNRRETEGLIGFFVNTLVLRADLSNGGLSSFRGALARVREVTLDAYTHQDLPFEKLVDRLEPERSLAHTPLFQVMFVLQDVPRGDTRLADLTLRALTTDAGAAKFDLELTMVEGAVGLAGKLIYDRDLFDATTIRRMLGHFETLMATVSRCPEERLATLPILSAGERQQLQVEWNDSRSPYLEEASLSRRFEQQVERTPRAIAVSFEGQAWTYRQLDRRANRLAHHLRARGVGPEALVGVCMERSLEMVLGLLGVLKAGGAYVPLDPSYPEERLAVMLEDSRVAVLLTQEKFVDGFSTSALELVVLGTDPSPFAGESEASPDGDGAVENLAYMIYTSGTTGRPKGVMNSHKGVSNRLRWMQETYPLDVGDRVLQKTPFSFDVSAWEFFWPLLVGARLVIARPEGHRDSDYLVRLITEEGITVIHFVPSMLEAFLENPKIGACASLRQVFASGEALSFENEQRCLERLGASLHNLYGPTEAAIDVTHWSCARAAEAHSVPIGRPVANTRIAVVDRSLQAVPAGVAGELQIGGVQVARGYFDRPAMTAERFIPDPLGERPGSRQYRTGDLVRYRADGAIEFLGRFDHQVKVRGFRIELGEIEAVMRSHPAVREAVVLSRQEPSGRRLLAGYVVAQSGDPTGELREFLAAKLPDYMVPTALVLLETLPLTSSGKIDRRALPDPDPRQSASESEFVAPRSGVERRLASIWSELLSSEKMGIHDNFFELGGDSILGIQLVARANEMGIRFSSQQLFKTPTIAGLAVAAGQVGEPAQAQQGPVIGPVLLTPIQRWFFELDLRDPSHFNQSVLFEVSEKIHPVLWAEAVQALLGHHDALRLRFIREGLGWRQVNWLHTGREAAGVVSYVDLAAVAQPLSLVGQIGDVVQSSFDLSSGPLVRVVFIDPGPEETGRLLIVLHHLVVDGISWRVLSEDLQTTYHQLARGLEVELPPKTTSFKQWSELLSEHAGSEAVMAQLAYWLESHGTAGPAAGTLPVDHADGDNLTVSSREISVALGEEETRKLLKDVPSTSYRAQIHEMLLSALALTLTRWTGERWARIALEGHGREELFEGVDVSRTVGWFTSLFPVRLEVPADRDPGATIRSVRDQLRDVPDRGVSYGLLRYLSGDRKIEEQLEALPSPEVSFNYLGQIDQAVPEGGLFQLAPHGESAGSPFGPRNRRPHLLEINGLVSDNVLFITWSHSEFLHRSSTIEDLTQRFLADLGSLIEHCLSDKAGEDALLESVDVDLEPDELDSILSQVG